MFQYYIIRVASDMFFKGMKRQWIGYKDPSCIIPHLIGSLEIYVAKRILLHLHDPHLSRSC